MFGNFLRGYLNYFLNFMIRTDIKYRLDTGLRAKINYRTLVSMRLRSLLYMQEEVEFAVKLWGGSQKERWRRIRGEIEEREEERELGIG